MAILAAAAFVSHASAAAAETLTAEQAIERFRDQYVPVAELDCPAPSDPEEIVVCGRAGQRDPNRLHFDPPRTPGQRRPGEAPSGIDAMNADACLRLCPQPLELDLIEAVKIGHKIIRHILDPE
jgi:hypothetical protein